MASLHSFQRVRALQKGWSLRPLQYPLPFNDGGREGSPEYYTAHGGNIARIQPTHSANSLHTGHLCLAYCTLLLPSFFIHSSFFPSIFLFPALLLRLFVSRLGDVHITALLYLVVLISNQCVTICNNSDDDKGQTSSYRC